MFALLGDIQFDLISYFDGFESTFGANFAEHALIQGKPRLQQTGNSLDEIHITLSFHFQFCDPEAELLKLRTALTAQRAMALVFGNGDYKGWFVLTELQATSRQTDPSGTVIALDASMTLREFVGDKKNPLKPPAVQAKVPPVAAKAIANTTSVVNRVRNVIRQGVTYAQQARSAIRVARDTVSVIQRFRTDPIAALNQVAPLLDELKQASRPLAKLSPSLASLSDSLFDSLSDSIPDAKTVLRASIGTLKAVRDAQDSLKSIDASNFTHVLSTAAAHLSAAADMLNDTAPAISRLAAKVITRES